MRVTMMLADHAQVAEGKLFISGGGWNLNGPGPITSALALLFYIPWDRTNRKTSFTLRLVDSDGRPVTQVGPLGEQPVQMGGQFEVGRPAGVTPGSEINVPIAINTVLQLAPGQRFTWLLEVDGHSEDDWRVEFSTRDVPRGSPLPPSELPGLG